MAGHVYNICYENILDSDIRKQMARPIVISYYASVNLHSGYFLK